MIGCGIKRAGVRRQMMVFESKGSRSDHLPDQSVEKPDQTAITHALPDLDATTRRS